MPLAASLPAVRPVFSLLAALCLVLGQGACGSKTSKPSDSVATAGGTQASADAAPTADPNVAQTTGDGNTAGVTTGGNHVMAIGALGGPNNAYFLVGRLDASVPTAIRMSLPNSRIGATFTGTSLAVSLADDGTDVYAVSIDGGNAVLVTTTASTAQVIYPVANNLTEGKHTVWLTKRTEGYEQDQVDSNFRTGTGTFGGFVLAAGASLGPAPAPQPHLAVALGDSSFTGYGAGQLQSGNSTCVFTPATQDATQSVPALFAQLMGAEVMNVSASGKGVVQSAYDPNNPNDQLPALWRETVPPNAVPAYAFPSLDAEWVLISAGSDDLIGSFGSGVITDQNLFVSTYAALLADMRSHYPKAKLLGIVNPDAINSDKTQLTTLIGRAVGQRTTAGDTNVFLYDYFNADPNGWVSYYDADAALGLGTGCQGHASPKGALFLAQRLATFVAQH